MTLSYDVPPAQFRVLSVVSGHDSLYVSCRSLFIRFDMVRNYSRLFGVLAVVAHILLVFILKWVLRLIIFKSPRESRLFCRSDKKRYENQLFSNKN